MKKEQSIISVLGLVSVAAIIWAIQLNSTCNSLKDKKLELETKLTRVIKDKDFIRAQLDDLEKKLEEEKQGNRSLFEQLDQTRTTIEGLRNEIISLTQAKQEVEKELNALKEKRAEEVVSPVEVVSPQAPTLPATPGPVQQESSSILEGIGIPISQ